MEEKIRYGKDGFPYGYTAITEEHGKHQDMLMDFGILRLAEGQTFEECRPQEAAYLLVNGYVLAEWEDSKEEMKRSNCFDEGMWVLHVPSDTRVKFTGIGPETEIAIQATVNPTKFPARLYRPEDVPDENRGAGTMKETCTRTVRTVLDYAKAPWSKLVLGEVINTPGKWSSYPPHIHPQPEIYYYRFNPANGYGYSEYGDEVLRVQDRDTIFISPNLTHPQVATPGNALWYLWVIRHLDDDPYRAPAYPYTLPDHAYLLNPDTKIWPDVKAEI